MDLFITTEKIPYPDKEVLKQYFEDEDLYLYMNYKKTFEYFRHDPVYQFEKNPLYKLLLSLVIFSPDITFDDALVEFERMLRLVTAKFYLLVDFPYEIADSMETYKDRYSRMGKLAGYIQDYIIEDAKPLQDGNIQGLFGSINRLVGILPGLATFQIFTTLFRNHWTFEDLKFKDTNLLDIFTILTNDIHAYDDKHNFSMQKKKEILILLYVLLYAIGDVFDVSLVVKIYNVQIHYSKIGSRRRVKYDLSKNGPVVENGRFYH